ncbi:MAG: hypothetical protein GX331_08740 [Firmicutes bacterium]|nr:hypothetical protein [Bacillota bacterium]
MSRTILPLQHDSFAPYGTVLNPRQCGESVNSPGEPVQFYPDRMLQLFSTTNLIAISPILIKPRPFEITGTEQHLDTEEVIGGFDQDVCFHVGRDLGGKPDFEDFKVFLLPKGWWVRIKRKVWHQAPFVLNQESAVGTVILPAHTFTNDCYEVGLQQPITIVRS